MVSGQSWLHDFDNLAANAIVSIALLFDETFGIDPPGLSARGRGSKGGCTYCSKIRTQAMDYPWEVRYDGTMADEGGGDVSEAMSRAHKCEMRWRGSRRS